MSDFLSFLKSRKPYVMATLEDTNDNNVLFSRKFILEEYAKA